MANIFDDWNIKILFGGICILSTLWLVWFGRALIIDDIVYIPGKKRHSWKSIRILNKACFCSSCEILLQTSTGLFCDYCGICSHPECVKLADNTFTCKEKFVKKQKSIKHLWVKGNLPLSCSCFICEKEIDYHAYAYAGLFGMRCSWCQRTAHTHCYYKQVGPDCECDFGEYREMIIPPQCIIASRNRKSFKLHLTGIEPPDHENWKPLIVIANTKSGSNCASVVISLLRGYLNPLQVMELGSHGPQYALQWALKISPRRCRILVAGGDGTVGWVLNSIFELGINPIPEVAIMPLGTGNDLSRVLGWGSEVSSNLDPVQILNKIKNSQCVMLDRWILEIDRYRTIQIPITRAPLRKINVYNYFSIGVDAQVTLSFHTTRESRFYIMSNRIVNKLIYFCFGTQQIVQPDCEDLQNQIDLYLDNVRIELPELQSIIFLNIDSWGAGVKLCELSRPENDVIERHSMSDGLLEVFGIVSSFHIAQLQVGLSKPVRLGQAKHVKIKIHQSCRQGLPMQVDGEPWLQSPCEMQLSANGQAKMLKSSQ